MINSKIQTLGLMIVGMILTPLPSLEAQILGKPEKTKEHVLCSLTSKGYARYDGPCTLTTKMEGSHFRYAVGMGNLSTTFVRKGGDFYAKEDRSGNKYPVKVHDHGQSLVFRWSRNKLIVTRYSRENTNRSHSTTPGEAIGNILDYFFSNK